MINKNGVYFHLSLAILGLDAEKLKEKGCRILDTTDELIAASKEIIGDFVEFSEDEEEIIADALYVQERNGEYSIFSSYPMYIWDEEVEGDVYEYLANYEA